MQFEGFSDQDFDAYLERKWSSNVFNLERLQVKQKLEALGRLLNPRLRAADGAPFACEVSVEHPALWNQHQVSAQYLFFSRNEAARQELEGIISRQRSMASLIEDPSPLRNHIFLSVKIDVSQVEVALKVHSDAAVDRENLQRKLQEFFRREKVLNLIRGLPAEFSVGIVGRELRCARELDDDGLTALVGELQDAASWLSIGRGFPRASTETHGAELAELAADALHHLLPVMHELAWSRDNDFVSIREALREKERSQRAKGLEKHDRVRVVRGMFAGKVGLVQSTDAKGGLKVLIGTMAVKLSSADVVKA